MLMHMTVCGNGIGESGRIYSLLKMEENIELMVEKFNIDNIKPNF